MAKKNPIPVGARFGRLVVISPSGQDPRTGKSLSMCQCDCGSMTVVRDGDLRSGRTRSCGCLKREWSSKMMLRRADRSNACHMSGTPIYQCWHDMVRRCNSPKSRGYHRYGGRGITVCKSWLRFKTFMKWALAHGFEKGLEIDRIDFDRGYSPGNCRFVDQVEQANNKSNNRRIMYRGEIKTLAQWSRALGVDRKKISHCLDNGGTIDDILD